MTLIRVDIEGLRGIARGTVSGIEPMTVIVGPNNAGKTTFLEAVQLADHGAGAGALLELLERRGWLGFASVRALLPSGSAKVSTTRFDAESGSVQRSVSIEQGSDRIVVRSSEGTSDLQTLYLDAGRSPASGASPRGPREVSLVEGTALLSEPPHFVDLFSRVDLAGRREWLIALLRPLLSTLTDLRILVPDGQPMVYVDDGRGRWPLAVAGDGFKRAFELAARLVVEDAATVLVEEPENHLHVGAMANIARLFWQATAPAPGGFGRQVIVTSHSLDFIDALFLEASDEELRRSAVVRMALRDGVLTSVAVPGPRVSELRGELGEDLRR